MGNQDRDNGYQTTVEFLRLCLRGRWDPAAAEAAAGQSAAGRVDWPAACRAAEREGVAPLLYQITRDWGPAAGLPQAAGEQLRRAYMGTARRNAILFGELERILPALAGAGAPVILLKGAALAQTVYGNIAVRPMADLDLLVREKDLPAALGALPALGYEITPPLVYRSEVLLRRSIGVDKAPVELHWSLLIPPYYHYNGLLDWAWQTALPAAASTRSSSARMLGPEAQVLHLCGHLQWHHPGAPDVRQLWLHDVAEVIARHRDEIDWDRLLAWAQEYDLVLPAQRTLARVAADYWSRPGEGWRPPVPGGILDRLRGLEPSPGERHLDAYLTAGGLSAAGRLRAELAALPGGRARLDFGRRNLFPPAGYVRACYRVPHRLLVPLYYPYRWLLALRGLR